jgi:hypothetical protein
MTGSATSFRMLVLIQAELRDLLPELSLQFGIAEMCKIIRNGRHVVGLSRTSEASVENCLRGGRSSGGWGLTFADRMIDASVWMASTPYARANSSTLRSSSDFRLRPPGLPLCPGWKVIACFALLSMCLIVRSRPLVGKSKRFQPMFRRARKKFRNNGTGLRVFARPARPCTRTS